MPRTIQDGVLIVVLIILLIGLVLKVIVKANRLIVDKSYRTLENKLKFLLLISATVFYTIFIQFYTITIGSISIWDIQ